MLKSNTSAIGITIGDPCGIGPEVIQKSLRKLPQNLLKRIVIFGDACVFRHYFKKRFPTIRFIDCQALPSRFFKIGRSNPAAGKASLSYLEAGVELLREGGIQALVTAPVSKKVISSADASFIGHTEYLAKAFAVKRVEMMFVAKNLKTVIVTRHIPVQQISKKLTPTALRQCLELTTEGLIHLFGIKKPNIALCGLNPHAGEEGKMGREEITKIIPTIKKAKKLQAHLFGPYPADTLFIPENRKKYDAIVAMYHDQGLIPMKSLYFDEVVNLTLGLPFIRTSPAHGTAFDIAGKNQANPSSMYSAIRLAEQLLKKCQKK